MPKKVGHLYEQVVSFENCLKAVHEGTASLKRTDHVRRILADPDKYAHRIQGKLLAGWEPSPCRQKTINEGTQKKTRELLIPSMEDHLIHVAIMRVIVPHLMSKYDFASCGSIPGRGQKRVQGIIKGWQKKPPKYAAECDVRRFYPTCGKEIVMGCLRKFIKDEKYLSLHEKILDQMGGVLAIGFQPSHWYGNLVLTECDRELRKSGVKFVRYMDNYAMVAGRKRSLHRAILTLRRCLWKMGMDVKKDWQVFRWSSRSICFLCYRYYANGKILMRKKLSHHVARVLRRASALLDAHRARGVMSLVGIVRHCHSYNFRREYIYPVISLKLCRRLISDVDKKRILPGTA